MLVVQTRHTNIGKLDKTALLGEDGVVQLYVRHIEQYQ